MRPHCRVIVLLTALLAVSAWSSVSTEQRRLLRNPKVRLPASRAPSSGPALPPGDEFLVDTTILYQPELGGQLNPAVAFGANEFLAVWQDENRVSASRIAASGAVLDPRSISIGWGNAGSCPAVTFDGLSFLVAWSFLGLRCIRVAPSGAVLDTSPIPVCTLAYAQFTPAVASGDSVSLVVWTDVRDSADTAICAARVTRSGVVLDPDGILVAGAVDSQDEPAVTSDGNDWLVVWRDDRNDSAGDIFGARVNAAGTVLDTLGIAICRAVGTQSNPAVSFGGSVFLVAWEDSGNSPNRDIRGARVSSGGDVLDTAGILISGATGDQTSPAVDYDGESFVVSWTDFRAGRTSDIYGARVAQTGVVLDTLGFPICTALRSQNLSALARDDTLCLAVWQDSMSGFIFSPDIYAARVNRAGRVADPHGILLSCGRQSSQTAARAALADSGFLVVWEQQDWPPDIRFARLSPDGWLLDSAPGCASRYSHWSESPALARADTNSLIVWKEGSNGTGIVGARVSHAGLLLDTAGTTLTRDTGTFGSPAVASDGTDWLAVWQQGGTGAEDIFASRVSSAGAVLDSPGIPVCCANRGQTQPRVAFGDSTYLVVWVDGRLTGRWDIYSTRIDRLGRVMDSIGIRMTFDSSYRQTPDIAFGGVNYLMVWQEGQSSNGYHDICAARVSPVGVPIDSGAILIAGGDYDCGLPSVTFDGTDYVVAWDDTRSGTYCGIYGARVSRWGTVFPTFCISPPTDAHAPSIASAPGGQLLAVYESGADSVNHQPFSGSRIWGRLSPFEAIEESPTQVAPRMTLDILPNPVNCTGEVRYVLPVSGHVRLGVYDISGRLVRLLADDEQRAGSHVLRWDGTDENLRKLPNGVCFVRLETAGRCESRVVIIAH